jgi:uncharacterized protein (TIGR00299 family) protein
MILGALVDAGVPLDALRGELRRLPLEGWDLTASEVRRGAFRAMKVDVVIDERVHRDHHRSLGEILALIDASSLGGPVKAKASRIFTRLAEAESRVHGSALEEVHFHEVGAVDAIIDVTGGVIGLALLRVERVAVSALPIGGGFVTVAHGRIPIPGPGTAELLRGFPIVDTGVRAELVTPTGAAILTTLAASSGRMPAMTVTEIGYGAGTMDLGETPNVIRCFVGEAEAEGGVETIIEVETTIDDMSPQLYEPLLERLLAAGALDVMLTPVIMKRGRPGVVLTALCPPDAAAAVRRVLFEETTTIGVRWSARQRARLDREMLTLDTRYGSISFKVSRLGEAVVTVTPEFADVRRLAQARGVPVREVLAEAQAEGRRRLLG